MNKFDKTNAEIGKRIREMRLKRNMTQEELAEKAGICNPQQMSNIERGLAGISLARFMDICRVLNADADYLFSELPPPMPALYCINISKR